MKKPLAVASVVLTLLIAAAASAQDATPNFSGTWSMDPAKSNFGPAPAPDSIVVTVEHTGATIKITTTQKSAMGDVRNERTLSTDGKENTNKMKTMVGDADMKSTSKWEGRNLVTASHLEVGGDSVDFHDVWTLSDDGKVLTTSREVVTPQQTFATKIVFNKQP